MPNRQRTGPVKSVITAFNYARRKAGIRNFRFHGFRHTCISYMVMAGVDFKTIADLVGHTTPKMLEERYGNVSPKHKKATSLLFGSYMDRLIGKTSGVRRPPDTPIVKQVAEILSKEFASA